MRRAPLSSRFLICFTPFFVLISAFGVLRDGGIDPSNMGKGDWVYSMTDATNRLGGHVSSVTNENSLMLYYKSQGIRYMILKSATSDQLFNGCYSFPQFTTNLVNIAHANGILLFAYNRSYGSNVVGEIALADYFFQRGADGFVFDAEAEWESSSSWIGTTGPAKAWQLCSTVRSNWPTKFLAHAPFPIISLHNTFPYKEFGYWCDSVMPQIYHFSSTGIKGSPSAAINWSDVNWKDWQSKLAGSNSLVNGQMIYWTNSIKPITPLQDVYGPIISGGVICEGTASAYPDKDVLEFIDYSAADPHTQTVGGYQGVNFWRTDLHGAGQWANIKLGTSGNFAGIVNNIVIDDPGATVVGPWTPVKVFGATTTAASYFGATGSDTNSFGTNYLTKTQGAGTAYVQFTPNIAIAGDYNIYQWHPFRADASASAPFVIFYNGGTATVYANQQTNAGNWSLLGRFNFAAGTSGYVRVSDALQDLGTVAMADGIKFVFAPPSSTPTAPTGLSATAISTQQLNLTWTDRSTNETGFILARSTYSGGSFSDIVTLPANATNYSDLGLSPNTAYYYVVRAINSLGASTNSTLASATTFAATPTPPSIDQQPLDQSVRSGHSATFSVSASGTAPLSFQWRFKGVDIPGATTSSFALISVSSTNAGSFSVLVTNSAGAVLSSNAVLTVVSVAGLGDNSLGQLNVPPSASNAVAIAAGAWHSLSLSANGTVSAWGNNSDGQCDVPLGLGDAIAIAAGGYHNLAIRLDRSVAAWGANGYGQASVPPGLKNIIAVAGGLWHSLALSADGALTAWGDNTWGQTNVPPGLTGVLAIAAGGNHNLVLMSDGTVVAWGQNTDANGIYVGQSVVPPGLSNVVVVAAGEYHSLALKSDGTVVAWGDNSENQNTVPGGIAGVDSLAGGGAHSVALTIQGTIAAWGANSNGQCNITPDLTNAVAVAAGGAHTLVLLDASSYVPRLISPAWLGGRFTALLQTLCRTHYAFDFAGVLAPTNWVPLSTNSGNGALRLLNDESASDNQRFYRTRQW
jgi:alpha-tubulin suppressor-like RCC1 family protein